jgi:alkylhydroperoxidase family enzyme
VRKTLLLAMLLGTIAISAQAAEPAKAPGSAQELARTKEILGQPPRIAPRTDLTDEERAYASPPKGFGKPGDVPQMFAILLNNPALAKKLIPMAGYFITEGKMAPRDRELAILRNAWLMQAPYEWGEHVATAKRIGVLTSAEIEDVMTGSSAPKWKPHDRAVLKGVEELTDNSMISDPTWAELAEGMSKEQLVEFPILVGQYKAIAYLQNSLRMELRSVNPGLAGR